MKQLLRRCFAMMLAVMMITGMCVTTSSAATASKTVKKASSTVDVKVIEKKATKVKKGTTNLTVKNGRGYIKFVAPKSNKYTFTFSKLKSATGSNAYILVYTKSKDFPDDLVSPLKMKTKGGKSQSLWLSVNGAKFEDGELVNRPIAKRTGTVKLKKGQTVYMYFSSGTEKIKAKLVIKQAS